MLAKKLLKELEEIRNAHNAAHTPEQFKAVDSSLTEVRKSLLAAPGIVRTDVEYMKACNIYHQIEMEIDSLLLTYCPDEERPERSPKPNTYSPHFSI